MSAPPAQLLLDAHVHFHEGFSRRAFFDAAASNLHAGAAELGIDLPVAMGLMFTESAGADAFGRFAASAAGNTHGGLDGWRFHDTGEGNSLWATRGGDSPEILLIAGRQLVTVERLEVLALGCREPLDDGMPLREARDAVIAAGGVPVVPWGFGKWWFGRGRVVAELIAQESPGRWYLGDNAGRPRWSARPKLFARGARHQVFVLPGSDPLPLAGQQTKAGRCGFVVPRRPDEQRPAATVLEWLRTCSAQPVTFGRHAGLLGFARDQVAMQLRKRGSGASP
jgi:hypothetical protein